MYELVCRQCGNKFMSKRRGVKCCSEECKKQYEKDYFKRYYSKNKEGILEKNRKWTKNNPSRIKELYDIRKNKKEKSYIAECVNCGKKFEAKRNNAKYCSSVCRYEYRKTH